MSDTGLGTMPIPRQVPAHRPAATPRPAAPRAPAAAGRPSVARRRWGFVAGLVLMLGTLPLQLLGLALVAIEVLSPATDGSEPLFIGGIGAVQLLLLVAVAWIAQRIGGGGTVWRRRFALSCVNALLVAGAAGVGWALLLG